MHLTVIRCGAFLVLQILFAWMFYPIPSFNHLYACELASVNFTYAASIRPCEHARGFLVLLNTSRKELKADDVQIFTGGFSYQMFQ
jgi:hypothetical protein